ncbi:MAG: hypothetical protein AVDCRST_MAG13-3100, partial [uncultured Solirubrobacteraceae bacterium]
DRQVHHAGGHRPRHARLGAAGLDQPPVPDGIDGAVRHGRHDQPRRRARLPPPSRPGGDHLGPGGARGAVARAGQAGARAGRGGVHPEGRRPRVVHGGRHAREGRRDPQPDGRRGRLRRRGGRRSGALGLAAV